MTFERPAFLFAAVLGLIPFVLVLARYVRARRRFFPAAWLAFGDDRLPLTRLKGRQLRIAGVQSVLLVLLVLAFSGPVVQLRVQDSPERRKGRLVVIVDIGPRTAGSRDGEPLLLRARDAFLHRLEREPPDRLVWLWACPSDPVAPVWVSAGDIRRNTVPWWTSHWERCRWSVELPRLSAYLSDDDEVVVLSSSFRGEHVPSGMPSAGCRETEVVDLGRASSNVGLVEVFERQGRVVALVENQSDAMAEGTLDVRCAKGPSAVSYSIEPFGLAEVQVAHADDLGEGVCHFELSEDGFPGDNSWWLTVQSLGESRILVVDGSRGGEGGRMSSSFLIKAIRAGVRGVRVVEIGVPQLSLEYLAGTDLLVLLDPVELPEYMQRGIRDYLVGGGALWLLAGPNLEGWQSDGELLPGLEVRGCISVREHPFHVAWFDAEDDVWGILSEVAPEVLEGWVHHRHYAVSAMGSGTRVSASFDDEVPFVLRLPMGRGSVVIWTAGPLEDNSVLALHPLFPVMTVRTVEALIGGGHRLVHAAVCEVGSVCPLAEEEVHRQMERIILTDGPLRVHDSGELFCARPGVVMSEMYTAGRRPLIACRSRNPWSLASSSGTEEEMSPNTPEPAAEATSAGGSTTEIGWILVLLALLLAGGEVSMVAGRYLSRQSASGAAGR
jgi:hypothetical protein